MMDFLGFDLTFVVCAMALADFAEIVDFPPISPEYCRLDLIESFNFSKVSSLPFAKGFINYSFD